MGWSTITCLDCGHVVDVEKALRALEAENWEKQRKHSIIYPVLRAETRFGTTQPVRCPECGLRMRAPLWPMTLAVVPFLLLWLLGMTFIIGTNSGRLPGEAFAPFAWFLGGLFLTGLVAALIALNFAKPINCGRY